MSLHGVGIRPRCACPYCAAESLWRFSAGDRNQHSTDETFAYYQCTVCRLLFIHPQPTDIERFYVHEQYDIPTDGRDFDKRADSQVWKLDILKPFITTGDMLEIGPATGEFATVARRTGFNPTLIEMDPACCAFLRDILKHKVVQSNNPAYALSQTADFDVVCIWQAIEHVPDFWTVVESAAGHLRKGGVLVISTPNPNSFQARFLRSQWPHIDAPRHLYLIPMDWFKDAFTKLGLRPVLTTTRDAGSIGLNFYGWFLWIRNMAGGRLDASWAQSWALGLTRMVKRWEEAEGQGCSYVTIAMKT
jgi:2-polyprenyl-3-methyl-5-hydroxy-6-metoxy-1,4-benzoquinol methylase